MKRIPRRLFTEEFKVPDRGSANPSPLGEG